MRKFSKIHYFQFWEFFSVMTPFLLLLFSYQNLIIIMILNRYFPFFNLVYFFKFLCERHWYWNSQRKGKKLVQKNSIRIIPFTKEILP